MRKLKTKSFALLLTLAILLSSSALLVANATTEEAPGEAAATGEVQATPAGGAPAEETPPEEAGGPSPADAQEQKQDGPEGEGENIYAPPTEATGPVVHFTAPILYVEKDAENCDLAAGATATDETGEPLLLYVLDDDGFDVTLPGRYTVTLAANHAALGTQTTGRTVLVQQERGQRALPLSGTIVNQQELQAAISAAGAGGSVTMDADIEIGAAEYGGGPLRLPKNFTLEGGGYSLTLAPGYEGRHIQSEDASNYTTTVRNLVLQGPNDNAPSAANIGTRVTGGGIYHNAYNNSVIVLDGCTVQGNHAPQGGVVYITNGQVKAVNGTQILGNSATSGGFVHTNGPSYVEINRSTASGNYSSGFAGLVFLRNGSSSKCVVRDSTITGNASGDWGGVFMTESGAIVEGYNSTFSGNSSAKEGGMGYVWGPTTFTDCTITGNTATKGGALYSNSTLTLTGGSVANNRSTGDGFGSGGAIYTNNTYTSLFVNGTSFSGNTSAAGGVYWDVENPKSFARFGYDQRPHAAFYETNIHPSAVSQDASNACTFTNIFNNIDVNYSGCFVYVFANGGTLSGAQNTTQGYYTQTSGPISLPASWQMSRPNHRFAGWTVIVSDLTGYGDTDALLPDNFLLSGPICIAAEWEEVATVTYHLNDGSGKTAADGPHALSNAFAPKTLTGADATWAAPEHRRFLGWATTATEQEGETLYTPGEATYPLAADADLYARWSGLEYTVTYHLNDGSGKTAADGPHPESDTFALKTLTGADTTWAAPEHRRFLGWATTATEQEGETLYTPGAATFPLTGDANLYARWSGLEYTVTYHLNDGSGKTAADGPHPESDAFALKTPAGADATWAAPEYCRFLGWATTPTGQEGETLYTPGAATFPLTADADLYARWSGREYTVTFDSMGGSDVDPLTGVPEGSTISPPPQPTLLYHTFEGWCTDNTCETQWNFGTGAVNGNITLYAKWARTFHDVTYAPGGNGVTNLPAAERVGAGLSHRVSATIPQRTGYTFTGWVATGGLAGGFASGSGYTMPQEAVAFTAQWRANPAPPASSTPTSSSHSITPRPDSASSAASVAPPPPPAASSSPRSAAASSQPGVVRPVVSVPSSSARQSSSAASLAPSSSSSFAAVSAVPSSTPEPPHSNDALPEQEIEADNTPLGGLRRSASWSFLNLLLALLALLSSVGVLLSLVRHGKQGDAPHTAKNRRQLPLSLFTMLTGFLPAIVFLLLENLTGPMMFLSPATPLVAALFVAQLLLLLVLGVLKKRTPGPQPDDDEL